METPFQERVRELQKQRQGCAFVAILTACILFALPLSVWLWKLALGMGGR